MEERTHRVVAAVIKDGDEYLYMQRGRPHYTCISERWEFPDGKVEEGESGHEALVKEIKEGMDWDVLVGRKVGTVELHYPDFDMHLTAYLRKGGGGEFKTLEHLDYKWLTMDELNDLKWTEAGRKLTEILKTGTV